MYFIVNLNCSRCVRKADQDNKQSKCSIIRQLNWLRIREQRRQQRSYDLILIRKNGKGWTIIESRPYVIWLAIWRCMKTNFIHDWKIWVQQHVFHVPDYCTASCDSVPCSILCCKLASHVKQVKYKRSWYQSETIADKFYQKTVNKWLFFSFPNCIECSHCWCQKAISETSEDASHDANY